MLNLLRACRSSVHAVARVASIVTTCGLLAGSATAQLQVTSLDGAATVAGSPLSLHAVVAENLPLEVARTGGCSLLLADRALVQLCGGAKASFAEVGNGAPERIQLNVGELKAIAVTHPDGAPLEVRTPTASILLRGAEAHISVAPDSGDTVVSTLESQVSVSRRDDSRADPVIVKAGQQLTLRQGQAPGELRTVSRETLARSSSCQDDSTYYSAAVRAERAKLAAGFPTSDLQQIVTADFPPHGLPLEESSTPSALILELSKTGLNEEVCDPITCNPAYRP